MQIAGLERDLTPGSIMAHRDSMQTMGYRTTFAFYGDTVRRLKNLAARWQVSQAEVVRRALSQAEVRMRAFRSGMGCTDKNAQL